MARDLTDKVIIITGASSGIGAVTAGMLSSRGAIVIAAGRSIERLQQVSQNLSQKCEIHRVDVCDDRSVNQLIDDVTAKYGRIDVLLGNAGYGLFDTVDHMELHQFAELMNTNYLGIVRCAKAVLPVMQAAGQGHIIHIASIAGKMATAKSAAYTATKHAVRGFSHALRLELKGSGIDVSVVNPGPVDTGFFKIADPGGSYAKNVESYLITPDKVGQAIVRLIERPRMEIDVPRHLGWGVKLYQLFPSLLDGIASRLTDRK